MGADSVASWLSAHCLSVYETVERPSVCLSVHPFRHSVAASRCGGFAAVGPAARRYRLIAARAALSNSGAAARRSAANASSVTLSHWRAKQNAVSFGFCLFQHHIYNGFVVFWWLYNAWLSAVNALREATGSLVLVFFALLVCCSSCRKDHTNELTYLLVATSVVLTSKLSWYLIANNTRKEFALKIWNSIQLVSSFSSFLPFCHFLAHKESEAPGGFYCNNIVSLFLS